MVYNDTDIINIDKTGSKDVTIELQKLIDESDTLYVKKGIYKTGPLFLHSNMTFHLDKGAIILATIDETKYKDIYTRVAGIEMNWYPGVINAINVENITIEGEGIISGNGPYWYKKYWGDDTKGGMREYYDKNDIRFLCDYDCKRPRNLLISSSKNVIIKEITSKDSGFWNIHILYSNDIKVIGVSIDSGDFNSPSTDGIDIDSSYDVLVEGVISNTNDDSICVKSGRDYDGRRVNIPSHDIEIRNCTIKNGFGITLGSELTGGIYNINIHDIKYKGTDCAFRIKSSEARKGYVKDINISNLDCVNVKYLFNINLNWNPNYNKCVIPTTLGLEYKDYYDIITKRIDGENTLVDNINISNIKSIYSSDYEGISRVFHIEGFDDNHIKSIRIKDSNIEGIEYGYIKNIDNLEIINTEITTKIDIDNNNNSYDER